MNFVKQFSIIILFLFFLSSVSAVPGIPHQFYGNVTINGVATNGAIVTAKVSGVEYGSTDSVDGTYGYSPEIFFVEDPNSTNLGRTIDFYVNGTKVASHVFENGGYTPLDLPLVVDVPPVNPPANTGGSGGGGGGGGSGSITVEFSSEKCINQDIKIEVKLPNKKPATNATITVFKDKETVIAGKTDDEGIYSFNLTEAGEYELQVNKPGYLKKKVSFSLVDCSVEESIEEIGEEDEIIDETSCENINCNDNNPCTTDSCLNGVCNYIKLDEISCGDNSVCSAGECVSLEEEKTKEDVVSTGFLGLTGLQQGLGVVVVVIVLGIIFFFWKKKKSD